MRSVQRALFTALCLCSALSVVHARPLSIMVTNDDGFEAPGLVAVAAALKAAGHQVTVVAPRTDQSGSSVKITMLPMAYKEESSGVWAVDGSPADSVGVGLDIVLAEHLPDLVISGANHGQNLGSTSNLSGTVGAAIMASMHDIPGIAVSVGIDFSEAKQGFPSTVAAYPEAATFITKLVEALSNHKGALLPPNTALNVNYPARAKDAIKGARWTMVGHGSGYTNAYKADPATGTAKLSFGPDTVKESKNANTDTARFADGYITVSALQTNRQSSIAAQIAPRLAKLVAR